MSVVQITVSDPKVLEHLKLLQENPIVLPGLMDDIGKYLTEYAANEGMVSQGGVFDANWPRLSQKYALYKAKKFPGRPIMERSGKLKESWAWNSTDSSVDIGNNADYWEYHQSGTEKMPKRLLAGINSTNKEKIAAFIGSALERKFAE